MIILNLKGGTGNQLFQYALGRHLSLKNASELTLEADGLLRANITGDIFRPLALLQFNVAATLASATEVQRLKYPYGPLSKAWRFFRAKILCRHYITFNPQVLTWKGDVFLDGYFQSPRYFEEIRDTLLSDFTLKDGLSPVAAKYAERIKSGTSVSLHVRRGDYVKNPRVLHEFGICSAEYYMQAMARIETSGQNPTYFVFSDDIEWVKKSLPLGEHAVYVKDPAISDVEELVLMSKCTHNIIANSSFSWWGAWLNQNPEKIVIAPTPWFNHQPTDPDLIPPSWIQIQK